MTTISNFRIDTYSKQSFFDRWGILSRFVQKICDGRDSSHGHAHMQSVAITTMRITGADYSNHPNFDSLILDAITVGWLHDVSDHKYDHDGTLDSKLDEFGFKNIPNFAEIKQVIKLISFSSENKAILTGNPINYEYELGPDYAIVRHIVSDADKLEAIGLVGIKRCMQYTMHYNPELTEDELVRAVQVHAKEKLLRLKDEFIRTETGKRLAITLHQEMVDELNKMYYEQ